MKRNATLSRIALATGLTCLALPAAGAECSAQSDAERATLLELYTSEGCSSCPPADRWFSQLRPAGSRPPLVPLAFHIDYWDYIGWKDRFANPEWSARQRESVRRAGGRTVYTPQVLRNGRDFPRWNDSDALAKAAGGDEAARATIALRITPALKGLAIVADVRPSGAAPGHGELVVALTENRLSSTVRAGENRGRSLSHDHVVRRLATLGPVKGQGSSFTHVFALEPDWKSADLAVAAFVQDSRTGEVLQALRLGNCAGQRGVP